MSLHLLIRSYSTDNLVRRKRSFKIFSPNTIYNFSIQYEIFMPFINFHSIVGVLLFVFVTSCIYLDEDVLQVLHLFLNKFSDCKICVSMPDLLTSMKNMGSVSIFTVACYTIFCVLDIILNNLIVSFRLWRFGESGLTLHSHCSQVYFEPEWLHLIVSYLWVK